MQAIIDTLLIALRGIKRHGAEALDWAEREARAVRDGLKLFVVLEAVLMALGVAIAWLAWEARCEFAGHPWIQARLLFVENVGGGIVAVGVIVAAAGLLYITSKAAILTEALVVANAVIKKIPILSPNLPDFKLFKAAYFDKASFTLDATDFVKVNSLDLGLEQAKAEKFLRQIMAVLAWFVFLGVYATNVPVHHDPKAFLGALAIGLFLAYATVGWKRESKLGQDVAYWGAVALLALATLSFFGYVVSPHAVEGVVRQAYGFVAALPGKVTAELWQPRFGGADCLRGLLWIYGALALASLVAFGIAAAYFRRLDGAKKAVPALIAGLAFAGLATSGWYMVMSPSYCGIEKTTVAKAPAAPTTTATPAPATPAAPAKTPATAVIAAAPAPAEPSAALSDEKRAKLEAKLAELKALKARVQAIE